MAETLILNAAVAVATVYENTARGSGKPFWNVVTDTKDRFTAFSRDIVAHLIDGRTPTTIQGRDGGPDSLAYNLTPPLNTMLFFEARATGKVLVPTPPGTQEPPVTPAATPPRAGMAVGTPPGAFTRPPYRPNTGYQKPGGSWKPKDERPGLVTMTAAYSKDLVVAIIGHSADLGLQDPDQAAQWAKDTTLKLAKALLDYSLAEVTALGFKLEPDK
jgi:hypothetical protein